MNKIWSSVLSKIALMAAIFGFFYIIGDSLHIIPQSVKDLVSFLADNFNTFAFMFCFLIGSYVFVKVLQSRNKEKRPQYD
jgi:hypothetical protein